jgi:hypothetical protein
VDDGAGLGSGNERSQIEEQLHAAAIAAVEDQRRTGVACAWGGASAGLVWKAVLFIAPRRSP